MDINAAFPSKWLKAPDLGGQDVTVDMAHVVKEEVGQGTEGEVKPVLYFDGQQKGLVLNKTIAKTIQGLYGSEPAAWAGRPITLFPTTTTYQGEVKDCIRAKAPTGTVAALASPPPPPTPPPASEKGPFF